MNKKQKIQDDSYSFPDHYIASYHNGFSYTVSDSWGAAYCASIEFIINELQKVNYSSLLDVGCGDGRFLRELDSVSGNKELKGIDYSKKAIDLAKVLNPSLDFTNEQIQSIDKKYDILTLMEIIEHLPLNEVSSFTKSLLSILKKDGYILLTVPSKNRTPDPAHFQHFTVQTLKDLFDHNIFEIVDIQFIEKIPRSCFHKIINRFFFNKHFAIKNEFLTKHFYNWYKKSFVCKKYKDSFRIYMKLKKKYD